jgi:hypothetical protein
MRTQRSIWLLSFLITLFCVMPRESNAWWSSPFYTHSWITRDALASTDDQYPDLQVAEFVTQLRTGSNTESHDVPDGTNIQWWAISPRLWFSAGRTSKGRGVVIRHRTKKVLRSEPDFDTF